MDARNHWKLVGQLNVYQIALLLAGYNPSHFENVQIHNWADTARVDVSPFLVSLQNAIKTKRLEAIYRSYYENEEINWDETLIDVTVLSDWLKRRGFGANFFATDSTPDANFADPFDLHYAPKLAAATDAWKAVTSDLKRLRGKSPKQALEKWLEENAKAYDLLNKDGTPNKTGIAEIAKVANWQPTGGVPKTPQPLPEPSPRIIKNQPTYSPKPKGEFGGIDPDDEIPF